MLSLVHVKYFISVLNLTIGTLLSNLAAINRRFDTRVCTYVTTHTRAHSRYKCDGTACGQDCVGDECAYVSPFLFAFLFAFFSFLAFLREKLGVTWCNKMSGACCVSNFGRSFATPMSSVVPTVCVVGLERSKTLASRNAPSRSVPVPSLLASLVQSRMFFQSNCTAQRCSRISHLS
jgi:hypothetical protein